MHQSAWAWPLFADARQSAFVMWFSRNTGVFGTRRPVVAYEKTVLAKIVFCPGANEAWELARRQLARTERPGRVLSV